MASTHQSLRVFPSIIALTLAAGTALPVFADNKAQPKVTVTSTKSSGSLSLNGVSFHSTSARVANQRTITFANSPTVVIVWDEFEGGAKTSWYAMSNDGRTVGLVQGTENKIHLRYATFDPVGGEPVIPASLRADASNELYIVQFVATPIDEMRRDIVGLGGVVEHYLPDNAHLIRMNGATRDQVAQLPFVRHVGEFHPVYRLDESALAEALASGTQDSPIRYSIETLRDGMVQQQAVATAAVALGGVVDVFTPDMHRLEVTVRPSALLALAKLNEVAFIDPWGGPGGQDMDIIRQLGGAVPTLSVAGFLGQGVRGEVFDGGALANHQEWNGQAPLVRVTNANDAHGTACYGVNFATGIVNAQATGMVPQREQGIICRYQDTTQFGGANTRLSLNTGAVNAAGNFRSGYQTSSVGSAQVSTYTTISQEVDSYLFAVDYLSCQSQSNLNSLSSRPQAWAKNIVAVGGIDHKNTLSKLDDTSSGASFGPAQDGRQKPDLAHSYLNVFTTGNGSTAPTPTIYGEFSGTSSATPITAGHFGLLQQMWHEGVWAGFGGGSSVFSDRPKSTTAKALMTNTAYRYPLTNGVGQGGLSRARLGWGMADVGAMYNIRTKTFVVNETDVLLNAQTRCYTMSVGAGEPEFKASMVYIDPPPTTTAIPNTVNDLNLKVTSPSGTVYWGNNGLLGTTANNFSTSGGFPNRATTSTGTGAIRDTVESVFVQNPAAGVWTVEVIGASIVTDARSETPGVTDADFALVVTGVTAAAPCAPACYANCDGSTTAPILNVNDFICFQNLFAAGSSLANCDGSTTAPTLNVNDFTCFQNAYAVGCS